MTPRSARVNGGSNPLPRATFGELARRAAVAARKTRADANDRAWVKSILTAPEHELWIGLSSFDQDHCIRVARRAERRLASTIYGGDSRWLAAALLHDIGKARASLSMLERVIATLASKIVSVETARRWASDSGGIWRRIGSYLMHGEIGAQWIRDSGGRAEAAAWAEVHQRDRRIDVPGIPPAVAEALLASDVA